MGTGRKITIKYNLMVKVFSGSEILAISARKKLEEAGIRVMTKNNIQSGTMVGLSPIGQAVELFVNESDAEKAREIIAEY